MSELLREANQGTRRNRLLLFVWGAVAALLLLASGLPTVALEDGRPFAWRWLLEAGERPAPNILGLVIFSLLLYIIAIFFLIPAHVRRRLWYALTALAVMILVMLWLVQNVELPELEEPPQLALMEEVEEAAEEKEETLVINDLTLPPVEPFTPPSQWVVLVVSFGLALLLLAAAAGGTWLLWQRHQESRPLLDLAREAQQALDSLQRGSALRDVVIRCYYEMGRVLDETHGIRRAEAMTPREFERQLAAMGLPREPVVGLTRLFEEARYGTRLPGAEEERRAIASLRTIVAACQEGT